jgi:hypothetical protein
MKKLTFKNPPAGTPIYAISRYNHYLGYQVLVTFCCDCCGNNAVEREKSQQSYDFLEGHFHCTQCKTPHNYYSDSFTSTKIDPQLALF